MLAQVFCHIFTFYKKIFMSYLKFWYLVFFIGLQFTCLAESKPLDFQIHSLNEIPSKDVNCIYQDHNGFVWMGTLDGLHRFDGYSFKTFRINPQKNSISSNLIISIDEDSKGNIWIGTYGKGICKLNPQTGEFTSYENENNDSGGLPNDINTLIVDNMDFLWSVNWFGVTRIELDSTLCQIKKCEKIPIKTIDTNEEFAVKTIFQDKSGNIWIGTNLNTFRVKNPYASPEEVEMETFYCHGE